MDTEYRIAVTQEQRDRVKKDELKARKEHGTMHVDASGQRRAEYAETQQVEAAKNVHAPSVGAAVAPSMLHGSDGVEYVMGGSIPSKAKSLDQLLSYTCVENMLNDTPSLKEDDSVESALKNFRDSELHALPVNGLDGKFKRVLSIRDILTYFCRTQHEDLEFFLKQSIKEIVDVEDNNTPVVPVGTSIAEVIKTLSAGVHFVGILDSFSNSLFNIVSQLYVAQLIAKNISLMPQELKSLPVSKFMKQIVNINTIPSDTKTSKAFKYLYNDNITAAAVVDKDGNIVDTLSELDLVGVVYDRFEYLGSDVTEFLQATRRTKALKPPICCELTDTFEYVVLKLASTGVHRLWVVGDATLSSPSPAIPPCSRYLGFVNLTNVLEAVYNSFDL